MSALIPNLNIPINDGTIRITLRWKTTADVVSLALSQQSQKLSVAIHSLLNEIFRDEDGLLYLWKDEGTENYNSLSKMTPEEVRSYIAPSISVLPSQSQIIIALHVHGYQADGTTHPTGITSRAIWSALYSTDGGINRLKQLSQLDFHQSSTSTARFQEIEARIQRQQKEFDRKDRINTERLERMERQFTRFDDMDHRFDTMEGNLMNVMETQAGVGGTMNKLNDKLSALMDMIAMTNIHTGHAHDISKVLNNTNPTATVADPNQPSFPSPSDLSNRQLDRSPSRHPSKETPGWFQQ
ncbi:hypothetical protein MHU86_15144 [Fragilaria crotonensis]|nr:hypothetical protein MHU86_15144 [Fragilaria crotonensis]